MKTVSTPHPHGGGTGRREPAHNPSPAPRHELDDEFTFWRYADLVERRIVANRNDLHRKQTALGFPKAVKLAPGRNSTALFPRAAVQAWIRQRQAAAE